MRHAVRAVRQAAAAARALWLANVSELTAARVRHVLVASGDDVVVRARAGSARVRVGCA